jgi:hypothetical protein
MIKKIEIFIIIFNFIIYILIKVKLIFLSFFIIQIKSNQNLTI